MATKGKAMQDKDLQQTQGNVALPQGSDQNMNLNAQTQPPGRRRPPRRRRDGGHLSDAAWEEQSSDPRDRRE